jgi:hypothetical protein
MEIPDRDQEELTLLDRGFHAVVDLDRRMAAIGFGCGTMRARKLHILYAGCVGLGFMLAGFLPGYSGRIMAEETKQINELGAKDPGGANLARGSAQNEARGK